MFFLVVFVVFFFNLLSDLFGPGLYPDIDQSPDSGIKLILMQSTILCYDLQDCERSVGRLMRIAV